MGNELSVSQLSDCDPIITNSNLGKDKMSVSGEPLNPDDPAFPCGLVAKSYFNDTFDLWRKNEDVGNCPEPPTTACTNITIDDSNIAWESDVKYKFKNLPVDDWESK